MPPKRVPIILKENAVRQKTNIPRKTLEQIFSENVVEITFKRRKTPPWYIRNRSTGHMSFHRRMLCTSNWRFVSSTLTRRLFKWKTPKSKRGKSYYRQRNLLITWDLMYREFRCISLDKYTIVGYTPAKTLLEQAKFTAFYRQHIKNMPKNRKKHFSDI